MAPLGPALQTILLVLQRQLATPLALPSRLSSIGRSLHTLVLLLALPPAAAFAIQWQLLATAALVTQACSLPLMLLLGRVGGCVSAAELCNGLPTCKAPRLLYDHTSKTKPSALLVVRL